MLKHLGQKAPNGKRIVGAIGLQPMHVPIKGIDESDLSLDMDFENATPMPLRRPEPVFAPDGGLMLYDESGEHWSATELDRGVKDEDALHHAYNAEMRHAIN